MIADAKEVNARNEIVACDILIGQSHSIGKMTLV